MKAGRAEPTVAGGTVIESKAFRQPCASVEQAHYQQSHIPWCQIVLCYNRSSSSNSGDLGSREVFAMPARDSQRLGSAPSAEMAKDRDVETGSVIKNVSTGCERST